MNKADKQFIEKHGEFMMCPNCSGLFKTLEIYPLPEGADIAICPFCNDILEFLEEK